MHCYNRPQNKKGKQHVPMRFSDTPRVRPSRSTTRNTTLFFLSLFFCVFVHYLVNEPIWNTIGSLIKESRISNTNINKVQDVVSNSDNENTINLADISVNVEHTQREETPGVVGSNNDDENTLEKFLPKEVRSCSKYMTNKKRKKLATEFVDKLDFDNINRFVMFFGLNGSGNTWISSVLDASPNALIANEINVLKMNVEKRNIDKIFNLLAGNSFLCGKYGRLHNNTLPGLWQGKVRDRINVIGDTKPGQNTKILLDKGREPWKNTEHARRQIEYFDKFLEDLEVEPRMIIVLRNPLDLIATQVVINRKEVVDEEIISTVFIRYRELMWAIKNLGRSHQWHVVKMEDFATNTEEELLRLCKFTGIDCPAEMVVKVVEKTQHQVPPVQHMVSLTKDQEKRVNIFTKENLSLYYK